MDHKQPLYLRIETFSLQLFPTLGSLVSPSQLPDTQTSKLLDSGYTQKRHRDNFSCPNGPLEVLPYI